MKSNSLDIHLYRALTLISATSERPCQVRGGAPGAPPIYLGSGAKFSPKIMFPWKVASIPTHLTLFQNFFSITPPKTSKNWESSEKSLKMGEIFKICNFWAISTCNTSKKRIFHIEFNFKQKKYDLFEKNAKKSNFKIFFSKIFLTSCLRLQIFQICEKKFQNWVALFFGKVLKIKVTKGELIISNHVEMADQYLLGGARGAPPPALIRVNRPYLRETDKMCPPKNRGPS